MMVGDMIGLIGIALVVVIGVIGVVIKIRKKKEDRVEVKEIEKVEERKRVIYSREFYRDEFQGDEMKEEESRGTTFLTCEDDSSMWVCPSCETKNSLLKQRCCICHYERNEGV